MRPEFHWALWSSLAVALLLTLYPFFQSGTHQQNPGTHENFFLFSFGLLPFVAIYFIAGVLMLFSRKSESFAKGILWSALILLFLMMVPFIFRSVFL
jgi:hypothetical protein